MWGGQTSVLPTPRGSWKEEWGYCMEDWEVELLPDPGAQSKYAFVECEPPPSDTCYRCVGPWALYAACLYWAVMTITSIGYGDITPAPTNAAEQVVAVVLMVIGAMMWGNVIATFCGVVQTMNPANTVFRNTMDELNRFMDVQHLPAEMQRRLREYFHQTKHLQRAASDRALLQKMSPSLQGEVAIRCNERWLKRVWYLVHTEEEFLVQVALHLSAMVFAPGELVASNFLYIVHRGVALYGGQVLTAGKVWGEDMILISDHLRRKYCARAMNYLEVYMLGREELMTVALGFPDTHTHLRKQAFKLAVRREFIHVAKARKSAAGEAWGSSATRTFDRILSDASSVETHDASKGYNRQQGVRYAGMRRGSGGGRGSAVEGDGDDVREMLHQLVAAQHAHANQLHALGVQIAALSGAAPPPAPAPSPPKPKKLSEVYDGPSSGRASTSSGAGSPAPVRRGPSRGPSFAVTTFGAALDAAGLGR